jgi:excisionase family DNA binding protein
VEVYLTVKEVAEMVRLTVQTIRRYTWKNEIPHHRINRAVRYKKSEIEQWVEKREAAKTKGQGGLFNDTDSGVHIL